VSEVITVLARLDGDARGAVNAFSQADRAAREMADQSDKTAKQAEGSFSRMEGGVSKVMGRVAGVLAAAFSVAAVANWGKETIASLGRIEAINSQTEAALTSTGAAAWTTAGQIEDMASSLERLTGTEAESIQEGANLLLTFKNIQNQAGAGNNIFDQATAAMVDMARAMGTDASSGAIQLGKALNDPVAGIAALSRVGVTFTGDQEAMIRSMVAAGDVMGAQKIILAELNSQFGGSGAAYAQTYAGSIELLKHSFGTLSETLLGGFMPILTQLAQVGTTAFSWLNEQEGVTSFGQNVIDAFSGIWSAVQPVVEQLGAALGPVFAQLAPLVLQLWSALSPLGIIFESLQPVLPIITNMLTTLGGILAGALRMAIPIVTDLVGRLADYLSGALSSVLPVVAGLLETMGGVMQQILPVILNVVGALGDAFMSVLEALLPVLPPLFDALSAIIDALLPIIPAVLSIVTAFLPLITIVGELIGAILPPLVEILTAVLGPILALVSPLLELLGPALEWVGEVIGGVIQWLVEAGGGAESFSTVIGAVAAGVSGYFEQFGAVIGAVMDGVTAAVTWVAKAVQQQFNSIMNAVKLVGSVFQNIFGAIGGFISSAFNNAVGVVKGAINGIIGLVNGAIGFLNTLRVSIPDWVPGIGGQTFGVSLPRIPMLADGGTLLQSGLTWVGERGPELLNLPRGAVVTPRQDIPRMYGSSGSRESDEERVVVHQEFHIYSPTSADPLESTKEAAGLMRTGLALAGVGR
jgi:phage-related protein